MKKLLLIATLFAIGSQIEAMDRPDAFQSYGTTTRPVYFDHTSNNIAHIKTAAEYWPTVATTKPVLSKQGQKIATVETAYLIVPKTYSSGTGSYTVKENGKIYTVHFVMEQPEQDRTSR